MTEPGTTDRACARELVSAALDRATAVEGLHAFITLDSEAALHEAARRDARRVGGSWTLVVKDNVHVEGLPNTAGTPGLSGFVPDTDAPVVASLRAAGAIVLGKTNMHELALGATSCNQAFGAVGNATDPALFAGGSSGGTAAAVAAGVADVGLGTDTGGSVTVPAALNGIYGLRPTAGRYPRAGVTPLSPTRDTPGPLARTLDRLAAVDTLVTGETGGPPDPGRRLRLGLPRHVFAEDLEGPVASAWDEAVHRLTTDRIEWVPVDTARLAEFDARIGIPLVLGEFATAFGRYLATHRTGLTPAEVLDAAADPVIADLLRAALPTGPAYAGPSALDETLAARRLMQAAYADVFQQNGLDAIVAPTVPVCARPLRRYEEFLPLNGRDVPTFPTLIRNTSPAATAGLPSVTLPLPVTASAPVGVQLIGARGTDRDLLSAAARIEALLRPGAAE